MPRSKTESSIFQAVRWRPNFNKYTLGGFVRGVWWSSVLSDTHLFEGEIPQVDIDALGARRTAACCTRSPDGAPKPTVPRWGSLRDIVFFPCPSIFPQHELNINTICFLDVQEKNRLFFCKMYGVYFLKNPLQGFAQQNLDALVNKLVERSISGFC